MQGPLTNKSRYFVHDILLVEMSTWRDKVAAERLAAKKSAPAPASKDTRELGANGGIAKRRGGRKERRRSAHGKVESKASKKGSSSLGSRIRGLQRTLAHSGESMSAAARKEKEEEIASLRALSEDRKRRERERTLAKKYHMVKFFERRKLERRLQALKQQEERKKVSKEDVEAKRKALEDDLFYVANFPKDIPYVALFPSGGHDDESRAKVEKLRKRIREERRGQKLAKMIVQPKQVHVQVQQKKTTNPMHS